MRYKVVKTEVYIVIERCILDRWKRCENDSVDEIILWCLSQWGQKVNQTEEKGPWDIGNLRQPSATLGLHILWPYISCKLHKNAASPLWRHADESFLMTATWRTSPPSWKRKLRFWQVSLPVSLLSVWFKHFSAIIRCWFERRFNHWTFFVLIFCDKFSGIWLISLCTRSRHFHYSVLSVVIYVLSEDSSQVNSSCWMTSHKV